MHAFLTLIQALWPIALGFAALFIFARFYDSVARRVAPDLLSGARSPPAFKAPRDLLGWLKFIGPRVGAALVVLLYILGPLALQYAVVLLVSLGLSWLSYKQRIRPLFARSVTFTEQVTLVLLCAAWIVLWSYFLVRFINERHAASSNRGVTNQHIVRAARLSAKIRQPHDGRI